MTITHLPAGGLLLIAVSVCSVSLGADNVLEQAPGVQRTPPGLFSTQPGSAGVADVAGMDNGKLLQDPKQRAELRKEQRQRIQLEYGDIAEVISLDPRMESDLMELLTDQEMARLDLFYGNGSDAVSTRRRGGIPESYTAAQSRDQQQIRVLLGEERFAGYLEYTDTRTERHQVNDFNARLAPGEKLTADQKTRLMAVLRDHQGKMSRQGMRSTSPLPPPALPARAEDREAQRRRDVIAMHEHSFREMQQDSRALLARLPEVLTSQQLDAYTRLEAAAIAARRSFVQYARVSAGMSPEFDETPLPSP
jgi:hypothetical protein